MENIIEEYAGIVMAVIIVYAEHTYKSKQYKIN